MDTSSPNFTIIPVAVQSDFMQHQARATPVLALAECVWNSLDADAGRVEVEFDRNAIGLERIVIRDDGKGMTREQASDVFSKLGGSWKRLRGRTDSGRELHGSEGRGRYKVTALGRVADWRVTYDAGGGNYRSYTITLIRDDLKGVRFTEEAVTAASRPGVELVITEPLADFRSLQADDTPQDLAEIFATYLRNYKGVTISVQGVKLDPSALIVGDPAEMNLSDIQDGDNKHPVRLEIVEWKRKTKRVLHLCDDRGFPLLNVDTRWHVGERFFSAYLRSALIREVSDRNEIGVAEMNPALAAAVEEARQRIKDHFRAKAAEEAQSVVAEWKAENSYPYEQPPQTPVEQVTREVFDIMATTAARYLPEIGSTSRKARTFQLRMMRTAIENGSEDLQAVMKEVLNLPARQLEELAQLVQESSLQAIISSSREVANRLKFLTALHALIFDKNMGDTVRERTQLQRLLVDNAWIFGEENRLMVDDKSLDECLKQHAQAKNIFVAKGAVKHPNKVRGIVDLMFGLQRSSHNGDGLEHLVVELKGPTVSIGQAEVAQVEGYVGAIIDDARFDTSKTKWTFWALSRKVDPSLLRIRQLPGADHGVITKQDQLVIMVKTWAQVIEENRARMKFFQDGLQFRVTKGEALRHLKEGYESILKGTPVENAIDETIAEEEAISRSPP